MSFLRLAATPARCGSSSFTRYLTTSARHPRRIFTGTSTLVYGGAILATAPLLFSTVYAEENKVSEDQFIAVGSETTKDNATGIEFPKSLRMTTKGLFPTVSLVGLGVRTVSFLGIKVYSVGFYADLNNPALQLSEEMSVEEKIEHVVRSSACVIRIVPTRDTSFTHLRDAFVRAVGVRMLERRKSGELSEDEASTLGHPLGKLKTLFPNTPLKKHVPLDIFLAPPIPGRQRALIFRDLGGIESDWMAVEFVLFYFGTNLPSPPLMASVSEAMALMPQKK